MKSRAEADPVGRCGATVPERRCHPWADPQGSAPRQCLAWADARAVDQLAAVGWNRARHLVLRCLPGPASEPILVTISFAIRKLAQERVTGVPPGHPGSLPSVQPAR